jgi:FdhE protein
VDAAMLAKCYLEGDRGSHDALSRTLGVSVAALEFVVDLMVSTVLAALEPMLAEKIRDIPWDKGYCPICGSLPNISYLAAPAGLSSEFLRGGGGQKYLHCSTCGHDWRIKRQFCPACGNDHKDMLLYYQVQDETVERVDVCRKCGLYLPCMDLREVDAKPHLDMAAVGMVHLDAYAQQQGFSPMVWTIWNRLE